MRIRIWILYGSGSGSSVSVLVVQYLDLDLDHQFVLGYLELMILIRGNRDAPDLWLCVCCVVCGL
jgi:hypothetical protein